MPTRGMERWLTQRLSRRSAPARAAGRRLRERRVPVAAAAGRRRRRGGVRDRPGDGPVAARAARCGRCWRSSTRRSRAVAAPLAATSADGGEPGAALRRRVRHSPSCSTATRSTGRSSMRALGAPARTAGPAARLAGRAVAAAARADRRARARPSGSTARARGCAPSRSSSSCPSGSRCSASRACRPATSRSCARSPTHRDVHLFLLHPSPALWEERRRLAPARVGRRADDPTRRAARQPPARLLGPATRASCSSCSARGVDATTTTRSPHRAGTLLARLQAAVREDRRRARRADERPPLDPTTAASQVHACHGRARQVEVAARRDPAPARRRPDARAARRDRHVPGHRDVRAADPGDVRRRRDARRRGPSRRRAAAAGPARAARRPRAAPDQPGARRRRAAARARRRAADRLPGARPRRPRAGPPALPASTTTTSRGSQDWVARQRHPLGPRRRAPRAVQARARCRRAPGAPASTGAARRDDDRGRAAGCSAACCRSTTSTAATSTSPAGSPSSSTGCGAAVDALPGAQPVAAGPTRSPTPPTRSTATAPATPGSAPSCSACSTTSSPRPRGAADATAARSPRSARCWPTGSRAARRGRTSAPAT